MAIDYAARAQRSEKNAKFNDIAGVSCWVLAATFVVLAVVFFITNGFSTSQLVMLTSAAIITSAGFNLRTTAVQCRTTAATWRRLAGDRR